MKKVILFVGILNAILLTIAFMPVNFFTKKFTTSTQVLVTHQECTGCPEVRILKGEIIIPKNLQRKKPPHELKLTGNSQYFGKTVTENYSFFVENKFYLEGNVVGFDSTHFEETIPIYEVATWKTEKYFPIIFSWEGKITFYYILLFAALIMLLIILILVQFFWK